MTGARVWLAFVAFSILAGCADAPSSVLRLGLKSQPITLDPRYATDAASTRVNRLVYRQLVDFDQHFKPVPALGTWQRVAPTVYRFELGADGREFHDGTRLAAGDVKATYDYVLDPQRASPHRGSLRHIERIDVLDEDTVEFTLSTPDPLFPGRLVIGILPAALIAQNHPFNRAPIGSGPFAFREWPEEGRHVLERIADRQRFELIEVPNPTVRVLKLLRGEIDLLQSDLLPELITWLEGREDVNVTKINGTNFAYLGFNLRDPVVGDERVRGAIAHAIDRDQIIRYVMGATARPANAILPPEHWAGAPELPLIPFEPETARRLLREAGYGERNPARIVYKTSTDPFRVRLATIIQDQLAQVGISVELRTYDWGTFYGDIKAGRFQVYSLAWVGIKMPDIFRYALHSESVPPAGANRGRFQSATADRLIDLAEATEDLGAQASLYRELEHHLLERLPYVPLWYEDHYVIARADIEGYTLAPDGNYDGLMTVRRTREP